MKRILLLLIFIPLITFAGGPDISALQNKEGTFFITYLVKGGESLSEIANSFYVKTTNLVKFNNLSLNSTLKPYQSILIPLTETNYFKLKGISEKNGFLPVYIELDNNISKEDICLKLGLQTESFDLWNKENLKDYYSINEKVIVGWLKYTDAKEKIAYLSNDGQRTKKEESKRATKETVKGELEQIEEKYSNSKVANYINEFKVKDKKIPIEKNSVKKEKVSFFKKKNKQDVVTESTNEDEIVVAKVDKKEVVKEKKVVEPKQEKQPKIANSTSTNNSSFKAKLKKIFSGGGYEPYKNKPAVVVNKPTPVQVKKTTPVVPKKEVSNNVYVSPKKEVLAKKEVVVNNNPKKEKTNKINFKKSEEKIVSFWGNVKTKVKHTFEKPAKKVEKPEVVALKKQTTEKKVEMEEKKISSDKTTKSSGNFFSKLKKAFKSGGYEPYKNVPSNNTKPNVLKTTPKVVTPPVKSTIVVKTTPTTTPKVIVKKVDTTPVVKVKKLTLAEKLKNTFAKKQEEPKVVVEKKNTVPVVKTSTPSKQDIDKKAKEVKAVATNTEKKPSEKKTSSKKNVENVVKTVAKIDSTQLIKAEENDAIHNEIKPLSLLNSKAGKAAMFFSGPTGGKFYVVTNIAPKGEIIKVTNTSNGRYVMAEVINTLPNADVSKGLLIKLSDNAKLPLGVANPTFYVKVNY